MIEIFKRSGNFCRLFILRKRDQLLAISISFFLFFHCQFIGYKNVWKLKEKRQRKFMAFLGVDYKRM